MRYGDGGGLNQAARARREQLRLRAAAMFAQQIPAAQVARVLEVSAKSAYQWRHAWATGGVTALASRGPSGPDPVLSGAQLDLLRLRLLAGPAAAGYTEDQRWTLLRVATLIGRMFHVRVGITTTWQALRRLGFTTQVPVHRAAQRDETAIAAWRRYQWPAIKGSRAG